MLGQGISVWTNFFEQSPHLPFCHLSIVGNLSPQPIAVGKTEKFAQSQVCVSSNGTFSRNYLTYADERRL
jgi:hypothetical protein